MQFYATLSMFTTLGANHLATTVRQDTPEGATEVVLSFSIDVPDAGLSDPHEWLSECLSWLLEDLSNQAHHAL